MSKFQRSPRKFIENFLRVVSWQLDQLMLYRWMLGGFWIKVDDAWSQAEITSVDVEGKRYLRQGDGPHWVTFHETNSTIEATENYTEF